MTPKNGNRKLINSRNSLNKIINKAYNTSGSNLAHTSNTNTSANLNSNNKDNNNNNSYSNQKNVYNSYR